MSDEETHVVQTEEGQMLTAEYKDGQLQIVEVTPFDKGSESQMLADGSSGEQTKYLLESDKGLVQLGLLNFTIVKCSDDSYQVMSTSNEDGETTLTCVISSEDTEENEGNGSYVVVDANTESEPLTCLQSTLQQINTQENLRKADKKDKIVLSPSEILEKAKALQKAKALLQAENSKRSNSRGRKRKSDLPPPMELLSSPNFRLYLYSCKMCNFKCNAIKEMSQHKSTEHGGGRGRGGGARGAGLQCARCPYRGHVHSQLLKHIQEMHMNLDEDDSSSELQLDEADLSNADVLVCGACGFESPSRDAFKTHIATEHGINMTLSSKLSSTIMAIDDTSQSN